MEKVNAMYAERKAQAAGENGEAVEENVIDIEPKEEITFDDFAKMQFQVGEIIKCEEVPKSKKLLMLTGEDRQSDKADRFRHQAALHVQRRWSARRSWFW